MDAGAIQEHLELLQFDLARPLLVMKAPKGIRLRVHQRGNLQQDGRGLCHRHRGEYL